MNMIWRCTYLLGCVAVLSSASSFNCPAPRSPENGLSFIFHDGQVVRFRCHPGFVLVGKPESNCQDNQWDSTVPECRGTGEEVASIVKVTPELDEKRDHHRNLFAWGDNEIDESGEDIYGSGPRRLPLINGLWSPAGKVIALANQPGNPAKKRNKVGSRAGNDLLQQELSIAEIRHKQQQEVRRQSKPVRNSNELTWRQREIQKARQQPNILYNSGSRSASAYRGNPEISNTIPILAPLPVSRPTPPVPNTRRLNDPDLVELRRRQLEQTLRARMNSIHPETASHHNADKAGLVEDARRRQFETAQSFRRTTSTRSQSGPSQYREPAVEEATNIVFNPRHNANPPAVLFAIGERPAGNGRRPIFPQTTTTEQPESERVQPVTTSRPLRPPPMVTRSAEKGGETRESLYQQYLQAEHLKRIMDYEIAAMNAENRRTNNERRAPSLSQSSVNGVDVMSGVDMQWLRRLSPDLQQRYLREVLMSRGKESRESQFADKFLKRHLDSEGQETFPSQNSRSSATGQVVVIQSIPAPPNSSVNNVDNWKNFDLSCNRQQNGQRLFIRAPKVKNAFIHRYEARKNVVEPFNTFFTAEYRCRNGYRLQNPETGSVLYCQKMEWIGVLPRCLAGSG